MNPFIWQSPTKFVFGEGVVESVGAQLTAAGWKRVLVVYGQGSVVRSGLLDRMKASLDEAGIDYSELCGVRPNPEVGLVYEGIEVAQAVHADAILAVGGGSVIDTAKAIGFGALYDGDVWDFFSGKAKVTECLPVCVVLTIPGAGSEASSSCVISNDELGTKKGTNGEAFRPRIAFMDPQVTCSLPPYQTAAGVTDMIAHICERYFSGVGAVPVTDGIAASLIRTLMEVAPRALENPDDLDARANIMWAGTLAHNDIAGCGRGLGAGRAGGWESHALEHALSAYDTSITHGAGLAVIMPAWMRHVWREDPARFELFGREVFGLDGERDEVAVQAIECLAEFFASLDMPTCLEDFGLQPDCIDELVESVVSVKGEPFGCFKKLTRDDVAAIYASAFKS